MDNIIVNIKYFGMIQMNISERTQINIHIMFCLAAVAVLLLISIGTAAASEIHVNPDGSGDYQTIQEAVNNASSYDTIIVAQGKYIENVVVSADKDNMTIRSERGPGLTTVQASNSEDHVFKIMANSVTINGFNVTGTVNYPYSGIYLDSVEGCSILNNTASDNYNGIYLDSSSSNTLENNTASNNENGIFLNFTSNSILSENRMEDNNYNFYAYGNSLDTNIVYANNNVDGKPIYYLVEVSDLEINSSSNAGTLYLIDCKNITVKDLTIEKEGFGILLYNTTDSKLENNNLTENLYGICLSLSSSNTFTGNTVNEGNLEYSSGIYLYDCYDNTFYGNVISKTWRAIYSYDSNNDYMSNQVSGSYIGNYYGDVYRKYSLTESSYQWINTIRDNATWYDTSDEDYSEKVPIGFNLTLEGVNYTDMQIGSNGVIQLIPAGSGELNASSWYGLKHWVDTYPDETFIFALCDDLTAEGYEEENFAFTELAATSEKPGVENTSAINFAEPETFSEKAVTEKDREKNVPVSMKSNPVETALMGSTFPDVQWYGYTSYSTGDTDSEDNIIPCNLTVIDYHVITYGDSYHNREYGESPLDFQVVLYENGTIRFNFKRIEYSYFDTSLYSGLYLGNNSSIHAKELVHVARAGQYGNETSFSTPVIRTLSSSYDTDGDGIADSEYDIASSHYNTNHGTQTDYYPLVLLSEAGAPSTASGSGTASFTVSTTFTNPASVGVDMVELYYKKDGGDWSKYGDSSTGSFTFSTASAGDYYFYTVATDVYGNIEGLPDDYDSYTSVSISSGNGGSGGSGTGEARIISAGTDETGEESDEEEDESDGSVMQVPSSGDTGTSKNSTASEVTKDSEEEGNNGGNNEGKETPGFELVFAVTGMLAALYSTRKE